MGDFLENHVWLPEGNHQKIRFIVDVHVQLLCVGFVDDWWVIRIYILWCFWTFFFPGWGTYANRNVYIHHCRVHVRLAGIRSGRLGHVGLTWSNHPTCWHFMAFSHPNMAMLNRSIVSGIKGLRYEKGQSHVSFLEIEMLCDFIKKLD